MDEYNYTQPGDETLMSDEDLQHDWQSDHDDELHCTRCGKTLEEVDEQEDTLACYGNEEQA